MTPLAVVLLLVTAPADPLPDGKTIDSLSYSFADGTALGPAGHFGIGRDGKASYSHATAPHTGSGGKVTQLDWQIPKAEAEALFRKLVEAGLFDLPDAKEDGLSRTTFHVVAGSWQMTLAADPTPEKILAHLRPYLEKAHPQLWKARVPPAGKDGKPVLTHVRYSFTEVVDGPEATLTVDRGGKVTYTRKTHPTQPGGAKLLASESWSIPAADAAKVLDALAADGLFELPGTGGGKFPNHYVRALAGRWKTTAFPKEMSDAVMKHLRPLLVKADPATWKKP